MLAVLGLVTGQQEALLRAFAPVAVGGIGAWQLLRGRPKPLVQIAVGVAALIFTVRFVGQGTEPLAVMGMVAMGIAGALFVRRRFVLYVRRVCSSSTSPPSSRAARSWRSSSAARCTGAGGWTRCSRRPCLRDPAG